LQAQTINLKGAVAQTDGDVTMSQTLTVQSDIETPGGDVTAGNIKLKTHKHSGVTPGGGTSGGPVP
jgi:phage baseplate assembly protein gpV